MSRMPPCGGPERFAAANRGVRRAGSGRHASSARSVRMAEAIITPSHSVSVRTQSCRQGAPGAGDELANG